jgi:hypothetical protein
MVLLEKPAEVSSALTALLQRAGAAVTTERAG